MSEPADARGKSVPHHLEDSLHMEALCWDWLPVRDSTATGSYWWPAGVPGGLAVERRGHTDRFRQPLRGVERHVACAATRLCLPPAGP